jgi:hypothetical protein
MSYEDLLSLSLSKAMRRAFVLVCALLSGAATTEPQSHLPQIDQIVDNKAARTMGLYARGNLIYTIDGIQLGGAPEGA